MLSIVLLLISLSCIRLSLRVAEKRSATPSPNLKSAGEFMEVGIVALCFVFLVIRPFVAQAFYIPSGSMQPTLREDDRIFVNKLSYRFGHPRRHDVVVFRAPDEALRGDQGSPSEDTDYVKRVIGLPHDVIEIHHGVTYVNGRAESEPFCTEKPFYDMPPFAVPEGKLFVMGDNRNHSNDSHRWGALEESRLIGKASFIFWPPSRAGAIR